ncbi:hypothetical protein FZC83_02075 [Rossellomorea marisflavi]|uniref:Phage ABA sandwich domain-containing protein n=1 Tax=Rossellomorea marisflavi TaxID=189381 RepID=A0A5D4RYB5_9BACI|nr:hypothetical protein [Rossellomorea marisflavi]TYS56383.1 hypothetical protein FZC83_02075 [Rossellomorea marisflavi]
MVKYKETHPHLVYEEGSIEEIEMIEEEIIRHILKWEKPEGKEFYKTPHGQYVFSSFQPMRKHSDAMYLFSKFNHIELEKEDNKYYACIYTSESDESGELIFFVESTKIETAISLAAYESIKYYKK